MLCLFDLWFINFELLGLRHNVRATEAKVEKCIVFEDFFYQHEQRWTLT